MNVLLKIPSNGFNIGKCRVRFDKDNVIIDSTGITSPDSFTIVLPKIAWLSIAQEIITEFKNEQEKLK